MSSKLNIKYINLDLKYIIVKIVCIIADISIIVAKIDLHWVHKKIIRHMVNHRFVNSKNGANNT